MMRHQTRLTTALGCAALAWMGSAIEAQASPRWVRVIESKAVAQGRQTADGGVILSGSAPAPNSDLPDAWIAKLDPVGNIVWQKRFGGLGEEIGQVVRQIR